MIKLLRRLLLGIRLGVVHEVAGAGGGPLIVGQTCRYVAQTTDVLPDTKRDFPVQAGDGCYLANMATAVTHDGSWWRKSRNFPTAERGDYMDRQRPRVKITAPAAGAARRLNGGTSIALLADVDVPNDAGDAIDDTAIDTYAWTASPNVGAFGNTALQDTTWTAPGASSVPMVVTLKLTATENYTAAAGGNISGEDEIEIIVNAA